MTDVETIAAFIRTRRSADKADLLRAIFRLWPDLSGKQLQQAINMSRPEPSRLSKALEVPARKRA